MTARAPEPQGSARPKARARWFRIILFLWVLLSCWALVEVAGWTGLVDYPALFGEPLGPPLGSVAVPHLEINGEATPDIAKAYGLKARPIRFHFRTDQRGFRNETDRDAASIYLLGDSCIVAGLIPFEQTLCGLLESALHEPVMNIALIDLCVQDECDLFLAQNLPLTGRLVLHFVFEGNDLKGSARHRSGKPRSVFDLPSPWKRTFAHFAFRSLKRALRNPESSDIPSGSLGGETILFRWTGEDVVRYESEIPFVVESITRTAQQVAARGGRYAVVFIPMKLRVFGPLCTFPNRSTLADLSQHLGKFPSDLASACKLASLPFLDLTEALAASTKPPALPYFKDDTHWSELGHEAAARCILNQIEQLRGR